MTAQPTLIHERVDAARRGENPTVICRMPSGWAVLGDHQFLTGDSLLLSDPVVDHLTDLDHAGRAQYLTDMARIGEAVHACTDIFRINYEILGNGDAALHGHVFPRYLTEPDQYRRAPVWAYPTEIHTGTLFDPEVHGELQRRLAAHHDVSVWYAFTTPTDTEVQPDPGEFADIRWWPIEQITHGPGTRFDPHLPRFLAKLVGIDDLPL